MRIATSLLSRNPLKIRASLGPCIQLYACSPQSQSLKDQGKSRTEDNAKNRVSESQSLKDQGKSRTGNEARNFRFHRSQSLKDQGKSRTSEFTAVKPIVARSQSLKDQGKSRTSYMVAEWALPALVAIP